MSNYPVDPTEHLPEVIICAANRDPDSNKIYISMRHGDELFWQQIDDEYKDPNKCCQHFEEGFYTNYRRFVNRKEAYIMALANNQIRRKCPTGSNLLYSEMLY